MLAVHVADPDEVAFEPEGAAPRAVVRAARLGDRGAFRSLFERYQPAVTAYCLSCARGRRDVALDLTQDVFRLAYEHLGNLEDDGRFQGWLFTIARNRCLKEHRLTEREVAMSALLTEGYAPDPAEAAEREAWLEAIGRAVASVEHEGHRAIVTAHYGRGEKTRDIAARLNVPHGTVTVVLMRFRERLKRQLVGGLAAGPGGETA